MKRREFLGSFAAAASLRGQQSHRGIGCGCAMAPASAMPPGSDVFKDVGSKLRVTDMKVFGITLDPKIARSDRPYVFVKLETNQGVVGWERRRWKARRPPPWRA